MTAATKPKSRQTIDAAIAEANARGLFLAQNPEGDLIFGRDGSKWKHNWVPLNAVAAAIKAKRWKGHSGPTKGVKPNKSRVDVERAMRGGGPDRTKARPPARAKAAAIVSSAPRDPFTGKTRMEELRGTATDLKARGASRSAARHRREMRASDRAKVTEKARDRVGRTSPIPSDRKVTAHELEHTGQGEIRDAVTGQIYQTGHGSKRAAVLAANKHNRTHGHDALHGYDPNSPRAKAAAISGHSVKVHPDETHSVADLKRQHAYAIANNQPEHAARAAAGLQRRGLTEGASGNWSSRKTIDEADAAHLFGGVHTPVDAEHRLALHDKGGDGIKPSYHLQKTKSGVKMAQVRYDGTAGGYGVTHSAAGGKLREDVGVHDNPVDAAKAAVREDAAKAKLDGHRKAALKQYGYHTEGGSGEGYKHANGKSYVLNQNSPYASGRGLALEQAGGHLGTLSPRHDGTWSVQTHDGRELPADKLKPAMNSLIAADYVRTQEAEAKKAKAAAELEATKKRNAEVKAAADVVVQRARAEQVLKDAKREMGKGDANRNRHFKPAPKPRATKSDTPTMQAARAELDKRLSTQHTDITGGVKADDLREGQHVKFKVSDQHRYIRPPHEDGPANMGTTGKYFRIPATHKDNHTGRTLEIGVHHDGRVVSAKGIGRNKDSLWAPEERHDPAKLAADHPELFSRTDSGDKVMYRHHAKGTEVVTTKGGERQGHVIHSAYGVTHIHSTNPETGKSEYFTQHGSNVGREFGRSQTENSRDVLVNARKSFSGITRGTPDPGRSNMRSGQVSKTLQAAQDELDKRMAAKRGVTTESLGKQSTEELRALVANPKTPPSVKSLARAVLITRSR